MLCRMNRMTPWEYMYTRPVSCCWLREKTKPNQPSERRLLCSAPSLKKPNCMERSMFDASEGRLGYKLRGLNGLNTMNTMNSANSVGDTTKAWLHWVILVGPQCRIQKKKTEIQKETNTKEQKATNKMRIIVEHNPKFWLPDEWTKCATIETEHRRCVKRGEGRDVVWREYDLKTTYSLHEAKVTRTMTVMTESGPTLERECYESPRATKL